MTDPDNLTPEQKTAARLFGRMPARPQPGEDIPDEDRTFMRGLFATGPDRTPLDDLLDPTPKTEES